MSEYVTLNCGVQMPTTGLGVYNITTGLRMRGAVKAAINSGVRMFDTASAYKNEELLGEALKESGIPRSQLFVTTKVWNTAQRLGDIEGAFNRSLERLGLSYLDLYLIHWPVPGCYLSTWQEMERIYRSGRVKAIGVANFNISHLEALREAANIIPAVNQIECHPLCYPQKLISYCQDAGIHVQAYAPLARGAYLDNDVMCVIGTKYARTPSQIGLRWAIQKGLSVIPKSIHPEHIQENASIFDFQIEDEDIAIMDTLDQDYHAAGIPDDLKDIPF